MKPAEPICAVSRAQPLPSSFQELFFFRTQSMDLIEVAYWFHGPLDIDALEGSLKCLVARHEILRTAFRPRGDEVMRVIADPSCFYLERVYLDHCDDTQFAEQLNRRYQALVSAFHLSVPPLFKTAVIRQSPQCSVFIALFHHIMFDGYSLDLFLKELSAAYNAAVAGGAAMPEPPPLQYADFAHWQRRLFKDGCTSAIEDTWLNERASTLQSLALPADPGRQAQPIVFGQRDFDLAMPFLEAINHLSFVERSTNTLILWATLSILLSRHSGQAQIAALCPVATQPRWDLKSVMGCMVNGMLVRSTVDVDRTFSQLLAAVKADALEAHRHSHTALGDLQTYLSASCDWKPVILNVYPVDEPTWANLRVTPYRLPFTPAVGDDVYDLLLCWAFCIHPSRIAGRLDYNAKLYSDAFIQTLITDFVAILEAVSHHPKTPLRQLFAQ